MKNAFSFPDYIETEIGRIFEENNWSDLPKALAEDVLQLSDFYIHNPSGQTPWDKAWAQRAGLAYFWPLNTIRLQKIANELRALHFFKGLHHMVDYGAGAGTASWIFQKDFSELELIERSSVPQKWFPNFRWVNKANPGHRSLTVFSYSLTELKQIPDWSLNSEAILIIEPSTQNDGRKLLELRKQLISKGYFIWAPCPHQTDCPLLSQSKTDWCHDRVHLNRTEWFLEIEKYLPMKNATLTFSYIAARKMKPEKMPHWSRLTGDLLNEKGKSRQLICRGPDREFLAWMHRDGAPPEFSRGDRVLLQTFEKKSNELRSPLLKLDE